MFIRDSMMARLALLVGIGLVTAGNSQLRFRQDHRRHRPRRAGVDHGTAASAPSPARSYCAMSPASKPRASCSANPSVSISRSQSDRPRQSRLQFPDAQIHDFLVARTRTPPGSAGRGPTARHFAQVATELMFEPYASKTFSVVWDGMLDRWHAAAARATTRRAACWYSTASRATPSPRTTGSPLVAISRCAEDSLPAPWRGSCLV